MTTTYLILDRDDNVIDKGIADYEYAQKVAAFYGAKLRVVEAKKGDPMTINMQQIVELVRSQGVDAYIAQTGGGVATIYAGGFVPIPEGERPYPDVTKDHKVAAGPGVYGWGQRPSVADTEGFCVGWGWRDDDYWEADGRSTEHSIAAEIVRRARTKTP